jgi:hypothetical protein
VSEKVTPFRSWAGVPVTIDLYGTFCASINEQDYKSPTYEGIGEKINGALKDKPVRVSIPFHRVEHGMPVAGVIIGIHSGNGNLLLRMNGKKGTEQVQSWHSETFLLLTPTDIVKHGELSAAVRAAQKALDFFEKDHAFDGKEAVKAAAQKQGTP